MASDKCIYVNSITFIGAVAKLISNERLDTYFPTLIFDWRLNLLKKRILGAKFLSWVYIMLVCLLYVCTYIYTS